MPTRLKQSATSECRASYDKWHKVLDNYEKAYTQDINRKDAYVKMDV